MQTTKNFIKKIPGVYSCFKLVSPIIGRKNLKKIQEVYSSELPTKQNIIDIYKGEWSSQLPVSTGLKTMPGFAGLFEDPRIDWAEKTLGGFKGKTFIELGPLEGGHSYMLQNKGAKKITAIEANSRAFLKCLCVKEILNLEKVEFQFGDFRKYFEQSSEKFDVLIASGVLYHMIDPLTLITQMCKASDKIFLWTHYYDQKAIDSHYILKTNFKDLEKVEHEGKTYEWAQQFYEGVFANKGFSGGSAAFSRWLTRDSILNCLKSYGFNQIDISFESHDHKNGPNFALCAQKI